MSIDVFGRKLSGGQSHRGPPGVGFKITNDGHYDLANKRLCNVATPQQPNDAVNLETLRSLVQSEVQSLHAITARLQASLDNLDTILEGHRDDIDSKLLKIQSSIEKLEER